MEEQQTEKKPKGKWFGRGIYGSKDVPIRVLDGLIATLIVVTLVMIVYYASNGGYNIKFDTGGGSETAALKLRYGELVPEPEPPYKPGYKFEGWYWENAGEEIPWDFSLTEVGGDVTIYARWSPANIPVKFDLNGGAAEDGGAEIAPIEVTFGETYGELPSAVKDGKTFAGWEYSGSKITSDTQVQMTGEHILTAVWE